MLEVEAKGEAAYDRRASVKPTALGGVGLGLQLRPQGVASGPASASASPPASLLERQHLKPSPDLLRHSLHSNRCPHDRYANPSLKSTDL